MFILLAPLMLSMHISGCSKKEAAEAPLSSPIRERINEDIANMACVTAPPLPFSSRERPRGSCFGCDKFVEAGLLTKVVAENTFASDFLETYKRGADIRFELTELGMETYILGVGDDPYGNERSRFCFGTPRLSKVTRLVGPVLFNNAKVIGIRYIVELENPHPFILAPRAKLLGIPLPNANPLGGPVYYPEANVSAIFNPNDPNDFILDPNFQIGM
jgi:hypothetical protein